MPAVLGGQKWREAAGQIRRLNLAALIVGQRSQKKQPDLTVVLVSYNTAHLLDRLFASIAASRGTLSLQIITVDNASRDGSAALIRTKYPHVELIENKDNVGFGRANNQALPLARGRYLLLLNTDAFVAADTLTKTVGFMDQHPKYGVLGAKLVSEDGTVQPSCRFFRHGNTFAASTRLGYGCGGRFFHEHG